MADGVSWPKNIHEYAKQCQQAYQDLKDIKQQTPAANSAGNWYNQETNTNTSTSTNVNARTASRQSDCPANFLYSCSSSVALNPAVATRLARSKAIRLTKEELAKLQRKDWCFHCKKVGDYRLRCSKEWWLMTVFLSLTALARISVSKVAMPQPGHVEAENKWPPQKSLWAVRNHYWSLHQVYRAIDLPMTPLWSRVA